MLQSDELRFNHGWPALQESDLSDETNYIFIAFTSTVWLIIAAELEGASFLLCIVIPISPVWKLGLNTESWAQFEPIEAKNKAKNIESVTSSEC